MYYSRTLSTAEALFVSRAQQKIAELGVTMAEQYTRNDVDEFNAQLCRELQHAILTLKSTFLDWDADEIQGMMDYYTIHADLVTFGFRAMVFDPLCAVAGGYVWATVAQLNAEIDARTSYDAYLLSLIQQLDIDYQAGDNVLQLQIDAITSGNAVLAADMTADIDLGGIRAGTTFVAGTPLETIWRAAVGFPVVASNFTCDSFAAIVEAGQNLTITQFTWDIQGTPVNLRLSDSEGQFTNEPVTGTSFTPGSPEVYNKATASTVTWTLEADNMDAVTFKVDWRFKSYYGKEATADDTPVTITEAKVLAGTDSLQETNSEVTVTADTANGEQGFVAVHKSQSGGDYTKWFVDNTNFSDILAGGFILPPVDVVVSGQTYSVYRWGYRSPLTDDIKLHR